MVTRGWPPTTSCAACGRAPRWCCVSQSRENGFGAPIRRWSPSTERSRQGRSQLSKAAGGTLCDTDSRRQAQRLSNTGSDLTYAQSYPQVWIARDASADRAIRGKTHHTLLSGWRTVARTRSGSQEASPAVVHLPGAATRSEERRVGKECGDRWSGYH